MIETSFGSGEDPALYNYVIIRAPDAMPYRINETMQTYTYPRETIEAWDNYVERPSLRYLSVLGDGIESTQITE